MKVLQIIETAYRATTEEQDDTVVWVTHAMKGAGGDLDVLLQGNAVNYAVVGQDATGLQFGDWKQTQPPKIDRDIAALIDKGIEVFIASEDLQERGISKQSLVKDVRLISRSDFPKLFGVYDQIWHW